MIYEFVPLYPDDRERYYEPCLTQAYDQDTPGLTDEEADLHRVEITQDQYLRGFKWDNENKDWVAE